MAINGSDIQLFLDPIEPMDVNHVDAEDATENHGAAGGMAGEEVGMVNNVMLAMKWQQQQQQ